MFDVIVVGARCAGAATAFLLARRGCKVLLVDQGHFPSDIPRGHFIHWCGPRRLQRWGLLDRIVASNCPPVTSSISNLGDYSLCVKDLSVNGVAWGYAPRRKVIDQILIDAAVEAGAEFRDGLHVEDFLADEGRISGIRGRRQGLPLEIPARLTIGADGRNSRLAQFVRAPEYRAAPTLACYHFSYWSDVPRTGFETYRLHRRVIFAHPTNDGLFAVFVGWPASEHAALRGDLEGAFGETLDRVPEFASRVRSGRRVERLYGAVSLPSFFRKPHGPGWALVGDAGSHKDPYLALGVADALRDAELLSDAIERASSSGAAEDQTLADYEAQRNQAAQAKYELNLSLADLSQPVSQKVTAIRAAVRNDPTEAHRYVSASYELIPPAQFFNPENLQRLLGRVDNDPFPRPR